MARLTDLPPEVRLKIYELLLVDPTRDGLRITMTFDPYRDPKPVWSRARCAQAETPHKAGHYPHPCRVEVPFFTLHHLDFTDLWALARVNRKFYAETSQTIYNNADLAYAYATAVSSEPALAFLCLSRYLEQHTPKSRAMLHSLIIQARAPYIMRPRDTKFLVDLVNARLPNLRVFGYQLTPIIASKPIDRIWPLFSNLCSLPYAIRPLAQLNTNLRTFLELPSVENFGGSHPNVKMYEYMLIMRRSLSDQYMKMTANVVKLRRCMHDRHTLALNRGDYLQITSRLRSTSDLEEEEADEETATKEKTIKDMLDNAHQLGHGLRQYRVWPSEMWTRAREEAHKDDGHF
ncbi:unnamed protein product [Aureobasidium mustum]|uniref:F-box domain-containing protein n=1 Tax=Aureobasidium mustum TaxID=2773714 RepID=A0A9N8JDG3_9PEZI|nr:unnamed protein product [Aureobasidium mustum]